MSKYICTQCGNDTFTAHQQEYHDITVDGNGDWIAEGGVYETSKPYGPFACTECDTEYNELPEAPTEETQEEYSATFKLTEKDFADILTDPDADTVEIIKALFLNPDYKVNLLEMIVRFLRENPDDNKYWKEWIIEKKPADEFN